MEEEKEKQQMQDEKLGTAPLGRLIFGLAIPSVVAQLINVIYNMVDRIYIGHIPDVGAEALAGLGLSLPVILLIQAFSALAGMGGAPRASIQLGKGDRDSAERILGNSVTMLIGFAVILTCGFYFVKEPLLYLFGASDATLPYAEAYLNIYLVGTIFVMAYQGLNMYISCQGHARTAMISVLIGAILNIGLDPLFIFGLHMGIRGAALATIISQGVSAVWVVSFLLSKRTGLKIRVKNMRLNARVAGAILGLGVSPFVMQSTESLISIVLNRGLQQYGGDIYVGVLTILQSVMQLIVIPVQGFSQGVQPIISYNYGANQLRRVRKTIQIALSVIWGFSFLFTGIVMLFPKVFTSLFTSQPEMLSLSASKLPVFLAGLLIFGIQMTCQNTFMGLGKAKLSLFIALWRKVILLIPLALILPHFAGVDGIYWSEPIADTVSALTAGILFIFTVWRKDLNIKREQ
ncbi:MAG: MATE family efflux transporter [Eubacterium sp.]|nr:MATE family efflux transporter [Eubacterium sp.]